MGPRSAVLAILLLLLGSAAVAIMIAERRPDIQRRTHAVEFQRLVGGLGFGATLDLSGAALSFDPRLGESSGQPGYPFPSGAYFGSDPALSLFYYPAPGVDTSDRGGVNGHASVP